MSGHGRIEVHHLTDRLRSPAVRAQIPEELRRKVAHVERDAIVAALDAHGGNQTHAARQLGISRFALIRLMEKYELKRR
jgi:DNA-binding NtrC family response regulator